jgi:HEAT repeat protein
MPEPTEQASHKAPHLAADGGVDGGDLQVGHPLRRPRGRGKWRTKERGIGKMSLKRWVSSVATAAMLLCGHSCGPASPPSHKAILELGADTATSDPDIRIKQLASDSATTRAAAAYALSLIGDRARGAIPELRRLLSDKEPEVQLAAACALASPGWDQPAALPVLLKFLESPDASSRGEAARALSRFRDWAGEAQLALVKAVGDKDDDVRVAAIISLGMLGWEGQKTFDLLARLLADPNWKVRLCAMEAMLQRDEGLKPVLPAILKLAADPVAQVRAHAAIAFAGMPWALAETRELLERLTADPDAEARREAVWAIGNLALDGADVSALAPALRKALADKDPRVRAAAAEALKKIRGEEPKK